LKEKVAGLESHAADIESELEAARRRIKELETAAKSPGQKLSEPTAP